MALFVLLLFSSVTALACTTMIMTKGASADGSMVVTHSDDDELADQRLINVPSHGQKGKRQIFHEAYPYPRFVTDQRGPGYDTKGYPMTTPLYMLPYAEIEKILGHKRLRSFSYFDGNYGIMNEHNLMMGECTNGANFEPPSNTDPTAENPLRIFYSAELSRIALENCRTAREAIKLMGGLIDKFGYYSTGETLLVADENEAWVFEMCALPDPVHHSVWVAKRVPDGHFFVAANEFRIRTVEENNPDSFKFSPHLFPGLKALGWWDREKDGPVDWLRAVSPGEYNHPYYSLRRVWRVMDRVNPDLGLSPWVEDGYTTDYPFSIPVNRKLSIEDVFTLYRDHYEGTPFDLTRGVAAGPYGDPHRFVGPYDGNQNDITKGKKLTGAWERPVSVFYQGYTYVCTTNPNKPEATKGILWFAPDVSYTSVFTPFFTKAGELPLAYQTGDPQKFSRSAAWWAFDFVANWSRLNFQRMYKVDIQPLQRELEQSALAKVEALNGEMQKDFTERDQKLLAAFNKEHANLVLQKWWGLAEKLITKYSDGYINQAGSPARSIGYPAPWLNVTDYANGPTSYDMKSENSL